MPLVWAVHWFLSVCRDRNSRSTFVCILVWKAGLMMQPVMAPTQFFMSVRLKQSWRRKNKNCGTWQSYYNLLELREIRQYRWESTHFILCRLMEQLGGAANLLTKTIRKNITKVHLCDYTTHGVRIPCFHNSTHTHTDSQSDFSAVFSVCFLCLNFLSVKPHLVVAYRHLKRKQAVTEAIK